VGRLADVDSRQHWTALHNASQVPDGPTIRGDMPCKITTSCPHCSLVLVISRDGLHQNIEYDFETWKTLCKHEARVSPALCLALPRIATAQLWCAKVPLASHGAATDVERW
jgi:hypothetical protein